jgi:hypothetical protein
MAQRAKRKINSLLPLWKMIEKCGFEGVFTAFLTINYFG